VSLLKTGVDIGGSLTKVVTIEGDERRYCLLEHTDASSVAKMIPHEGEIYVTGCGAKEVVRRLGRHAHVADELQSFCAGARQLFTEEGHGQDPFVLVSMGTGTSSSTSPLRPAPVRPAQELEEAPSSGLAVSSVDQGLWEDHGDGLHR
jgi:pantothenate kinase